MELPVNRFKQALKYLESIKLYWVGHEHRYIKVRPDIESYVVIAVI